jgi:5-methylcytosine-specific restriction endonuclease McrA
VKKAVYDEEAELSSLRAAVANLEAAIEFEKSGPRRDPIREDVKLLVWARDGGCCVRCGSKQELHFDHVIPVAKGGGSSEANIQILCQMCNLKKSDRIAIP